jgi:probable phosphoglycerate mutase
VAELVLVRHGRTDWNAVRRIQGQADSQLDSLGHLQAEAIAPVLAALSPAALWSSDSDRARTTASHIAARCGLEPTYDARLREYSLGRWEGLLHEEFEAASPEEYAEFRRANWDGIADAEKQVDVAARMTAVLSEIAGSLDGTEVAVVVSHGAAIRTAVAALLGWSAEEALTLHGMDNCGYAVLRRAVPDAPWRLRAYNRTVAISTDTPSE